MTSNTEATVVRVDRREDRGKNACRRMRARGHVPANVYGLGLDPFAVSVEARRVEQLLASATGRNTIFTLTLGEGEEQKSRAAMLREIQRDPLSERLVHVDFLRVDVTKTIRVRVPVRLVGTPEGVKNEGGMLDFVHREVEVECLPTRIPEHLDVDVAGLHVNQHVSVADVTFGEGVAAVDPPDMILAVVAIHRVEEAAPTAAPAEGEPEVAGKAKEEKAGEGGETK